MITFKRRAGYCLELLKPETIKFLEALKAR